MARFSSSQVLPSEARALSRPRVMTGWSVGLRVDRALCYERLGEGFLLASERRGLRVRRVSFSQGAL